MQRNPLLGVPKLVAIVSNKEAQECAKNAAYTQPVVYILKLLLLGKVKDAVGDTMLRHARGSKALDQHLQPDSRSAHKILAYLKQGKEVVR